MSTLPIESKWNVATVITATPPIVCSTDADCPEGYICKDGVCVKKEQTWWQKYWWAVAAGGASALAALGLTKKRNEEK
jgi:Cys-rich repeat protein